MLMQDQKGELLWRLDQDLSAPFVVGLGNVLYLSGSCYDKRHRIKHLSLVAGDQSHRIIHHSMGDVEAFNNQASRFIRIDRFRAGRTALLHYTDMTRQPWLVRHHPLNHLWMRELFEAIDCGYVSLAEIEEHARCGYVRPSLFFQAQERMTDSRHLPAAVSAQDRSFMKPQGFSARRTLALRERVRHVLKAVSSRGL